MKLLVGEPAREPRIQNLIINFIKIKPGFIESALLYYWKQGIVLQIQETMELLVKL